MRKHCGLRIADCGLIIAALALTGLAGAAGWNTQQAKQLELSADGGATKATLTKARLDAIPTITVVTPAAGDLLAYDAVSGAWLNKTIAGAGVAAASHTHTQSQVTDMTTASSVVFANVNATGEIRTGAGAGTKRIDASGNATLGTGAFSGDATVGSSGGGLVNLYVHSATAGKYLQFNSDANVVAIHGVGSRLKLDSGGDIQAFTAANSALTMAAGGMFNFQDRDASYATRATIDSATGNAVFTGNVQAASITNSGALAGEKVAYQASLAAQQDLGTAAEAALKYGEVAMGYSGPAAPCGIPMVGAGSVVGVSINYYNVLNSSPNTAIRVYKGSTAIAGNLTPLWTNSLATDGMTPSSRTEYFSASRGTYTFAAGDVLTIYVYNTSGTISMSNINVSLIVYLD